MITRNTSIIFLTLFYTTLTGYGRPNGFQRSLQIDENILLRICKLRHCNEYDQDCSFQKCMELLMHIDKLGDCPKRNASISVGDECVDSCHSHDYRCNGIQKCCAHSCGRMCMNPESLDSVSDRTLPPIPQNMTLSNLERRRNIAEISWLVYYSRPPTYNLVYILEARSHIGYYFEEHKLSNWFSMAFEITTSSQKYEKGRGGLMTNEFGGNVRLRGGRWYQFRMCTVNSNGTRGYSEPSHKFQLKERPKNPPPPRNFSIETRPKLLKNNTIYTKVVWKQPRSNYPIEKYRIAWSLYLDSNNGSLWQNEAFVQEPTRHFEFWDLKPNSMYYLQIQALSSFGKKRNLKSPKESFLLNTGISSNQVVLSSNDTLGNARSSNVDNIFDQNIKSNITVRFIGSKKFGLLVRISWPDHVIGCFIEMCSGDADCVSKASTKDLKLIRTKKNHFDFIDLRYSTKYSFRLRKGGHVLVGKTFVTPACLRFLSKHPQIPHTYNCS